MEAFTLFAEKMADCAGEIARSAFYQAREVSIKADKSFVTTTDRAIETSLRSMIEQTFPDHGIFGEEHGRTHISAPYQWVLDPIDGTSAFIAGIPTFTTLIALCVDSIPTLGIIDQPILQERWVSSTLQPSGKKQADISKSMLATTSLAYLSENEAQQFIELSRHCGGSVYGADAYLFAKLAEGNIDIILEAGLKPYDFCAVVPVVQAAGGVITDWEGNALTINSTGRVLAAGNADLHQQALQLLLANPHR